MIDFEVEDENRTRIVTVGDTDYLVECRDPYGFWFVMKPRPYELSGMFTTYPEAAQAIKIYHNTKKAKAEKNEHTIISTDGKGNKKRVKASDLFTEE